MGVKELQRLAERDSVKKSKIFNPDVDDFTVKYESEPYTINAMEIAEFPKRIADHIKKHLSNHLLCKRGIKINPQKDLENISKEIEI